MAEDQETPRTTEPDTVAVKFVDEVVVEVREGTVRFTART